MSWDEPAGRGPVPPASDSESNRRSTEQGAGGADPERQATASAHVDQMIYAGLEKAGFKGPHLGMFRATFEPPALRTATGLIASGRMFAKCRAVGRPVSISMELKDRLAQDEQVRHDIAWDSVEAATKAFAENAMAGKGWSPTGGASLGNFYFGRVVLEFPNVVRRWIRRAEREATTMDPDRMPGVAGLLSPIGQSQSSNPLVAVEDRLILSQIRQEADPDVQTMIDMRLDDRTPDEIARQLELTNKAVESKWGRFTRQKRHDGTNWRNS